MPSNNNPVPYGPKLEYALSQITEAIASVTAAISGTPTSTAYTVTESATVATTGGTVPAGHHYLLAYAQSGTGTVNGIPLDASVPTSVYEQDFLGTNITYGAVSYTVAASSSIIIITRNLQVVP